MYDNASSVYRQGQQICAYYDLRAVKLVRVPNSGLHWWPQIHNSTSETKATIDTWCGLHIEEKKKKKKTIQMLDSELC